jgi:hypothetical protein
MATINELIKSFAGVENIENKVSELTINKTVDSDFFNFSSSSLATTSDILINQSVSLDYIVNFALKNNLSIINVNTTSKNVIFTKSQIQDNSILNAINGKKYRFASGNISVGNGEFSYLLQENGYYLLQENGFKIIL